MVCLVSGWQTGVCKVRYLGLRAEQGLRESKRAVLVLVLVLVGYYYYY